MFYMRSILPGLLLMLAGMQGMSQERRLTVFLQQGAGQPAEKASVLLRSLGVRSQGQMMLTDAQGMAFFKADSGRYLLTAAFMGMETINDTISVLSSGDTVRYMFSPRTTELAGVVITGRKKLLEAQHDRFIYNVGSDSTARSKSLSQVLGNLPFVTVDGTGSVQVAGQSTFKVLVNGKETALFVTSMAQALRSFPADMVLRIELITAPGARYDAEGVTAIINIITKKISGYKGFATAYASDRTHFENGLTLTGRTGKLGITVNGETNGTWSPLNGYKTTVTTALQPSAFLQREVGGKEAIKKSAANGTVELNYEMDSLHSVIGYVTAGKSTTENVLDQQVTTWLPDNVSQYGAIDMNSRERSPSLIAGVDYHQKGKKNKARELSFRFNWQGTNNTIDNSTIQSYDAFDKWMVNYSKARNDEFTFQLDAMPYVAKKYTIEAGAKTILRKAWADYTSLYSFDADKAYLKDEHNSNSFNYQQQVYAAYGSLSAILGKNSLRAGIRLEQTNIRGDFSNLGEPVTNQYLSFIPNLYWSRKISYTTSVSVAYNLNLLRPYITSLNPYVNNTDSFNISYGNPSLGPQKIHKATAQVRYAGEKLFASASLSGSWSNDKILSYRLFETATGITSTVVGNAGVEQLLSLGLSGSYKFSDAFRMGIWGDLRYVDIRNRLEESQHNTGFSGVASGYFNWDVTQRFNLSGSGGGNVSNVTLLGNTTPFYFYQVNFGYHIVKDKLYATMNWNNVHGSYFTRRTHFADDKVSSVTTTREVYRVIFVGIQYTFGKLKQEVKRKKDIVNDDIIR